MKRSSPVLIVLIFLLLLVGFGFLEQRAAERQARLSRQLISAVDDENAARVVMLLNEGANPNTREDATQPPPWPVRLLNALRHRKKALTVSGYPVLVEAAGDGQLAIVRALVAHGSDVNAAADAGADASGNEMSDTALASVEASSASPASKAMIARLLLGKGANVNTKGDMEEAPLIHADDPQNVNLLIAAGADVNTRGILDETPLTNIVDRLTQSTTPADAPRINAVVLELLAAGADVNARDDAGYTALMNATESGLVSTTKLLLARGARVDFKGTYSDQTALSLAKSHGDTKIVALLKEAGEKT